MRVIAEHGIEPLLSACRIGSISIHAASLMAPERPDEQLRALNRHETKQRERQRRHALARRTDPLHKAKANLIAEFRAEIDCLKTAEQLEHIRAQVAQVFAMTETEAHDPSTADTKAA